MNCYLPEIGNVPALARLSISSGDTWSRPFSLKTGTSDGAAVDLTEDTLSAFVMKDLDGTVLFSPTIVEDVDPTTGSFVMSIDADQSAMLVPGVYDGDSAGQYWLLLRLNSTTIMKLVLQCLPGIVTS